MTRVAAPLIARWQAAWPEALEIWSRYTRLQDPRLCESSLSAGKEGLDQSFAMIRLVDKAVVVDLERIAEYGLEDYAREILAHEIGHHVLAPSTLLDHVRLLARMRKNLPTLYAHAPMLANLFTDLLINDRLQRTAGLRMAEIYERINAKRQGDAGAVWRVYMGIYETLWSRPKGSLGGPKRGDPEDTDAWLGAQIVRVYSRDWLKGGGRFAALMLRYLVDDTETAQTVRMLLDTKDAGRGGLPHGATLIDDDEDDDIHPVNDEALTGSAGTPSDNKQIVAGGKGQMREPFVYGDILRASGIDISPHDAAIAYYRELALAYLVKYPKRRFDIAPDKQIEGVEPWDIGGSFETIDWMESLIQSPRPVPGLTLAQRVIGEVAGTEDRFEPADLDIYVDSSGSMPDPQVALSYLALAGAVIILSALKAGARVQATLWSGKSQWSGTTGFTNKETDILRVLTGYFGGATQFPIHRLRETYRARKPTDRRVHILMIGDDGQTTQFDSDEKGANGWDISAMALKNAGAGGTMALNIASQFLQNPVSGSDFHKLQRAQTEQGWLVQSVQSHEDLLAFARAFSHHHYTQEDAP